MKRSENTPKDIDGGWRTARYRDGHVKQIRKRPAHGVAFLEDAARAGTLAGCDDQLRMGRRLVRSPYRFLHVQRERAGDQQHVRMAGTGDELDTQTFDVVVRVIERMDFQFSAVAGARFDLPNAQAPAHHVEDFLLDPPPFGVPSLIPA